VTNLFRRTATALALVLSLAPAQLQALGTDLTFTVQPTFTNLCANDVQSGTYTITNTSPVVLALNYIRIESHDDLPAAATSLGVALDKPCAGSLAAGASCNILVNLQPLQSGTFDRVLQIGIGSRQVALEGTPITAVVDCASAAPSR
jgi:hypothetical protein